MKKSILTTILAVLAFATAAFAQAGQLTFSWTDNSTNETDWRVERAPGLAATSGFVEIISIPTTTGQATGGTITYVDNGVIAGSAYSYRVRAHNDGGYSNYSNVPSATAAAPLPAPPSAPSGAQLKSPTPVATIQINSGQQYTFASFYSKPYNNGPYKSLPPGSYLIAAYLIN